MIAREPAGLRLTAGKVKHCANSVAVLGYDVAGYEHNAEFFVTPKLWVNGEAVNLKPYGLQGMGWCVVVKEKK